jgi:protein MAK11
MATVVAGTYERFVFGFHLDGLPGSSGGGGGAPEVVRSFTLDAHLSACKSIAAQGGFLASGGADDLIRVWHHNPDGATAEIGTLSGHEGNVTCMQFHGSDFTKEPTRLVSGSVDGNVIIWSVGQWDALKTMKAHRGGVHALSVHRSGLVAMSAGGRLAHRNVGHEEGTRRAQDQAQDQARAPGIHPER